MLSSFVAALRLLAKPPCASASAVPAAIRRGANTGSICTDACFDSETDDAMLVSPFLLSFSTNNFSCQEIVFNRGPAKDNSTFLQVHCTDLFFQQAAYCLD